MITFILLKPAVNHWLISNDILLKLMHFNRLFECPLFNDVMELFKFELHVLMKTGKKIATVVIYETLKLCRRLGVRGLGLN